jgi:uncharacterized protein YaiL (DUF2058 family)
LQVIDLTRQQELTKQQEAKSKESEYKAQAAQFAKVCHTVLCGSPVGEIVLPAVK